MRCTLSSFVERVREKFGTLLDLCVSSLRRGHANLLCIVPILSDDLRRGSICKFGPLRHGQSNFLCVAEMWANLGDGHGIKIPFALVCFLEINIRCRQRPYCDECTRSHPNSEVKHHKARSVLGWGTAWEALRVPLAF